MRKYARFAAMIITSTIVMYGLTYLSTYQFDHVFFSQMRVYMALIMGSVMAMVMWLFMRHMYDDKRGNIAIWAVAIIVFAGAYGAMRTQTGIGDVAYMRAMIPHHSIAILTSTRADINDPRVRDLADSITETQKKEIAEMKALIADLKE